MKENFDLKNNNIFFDSFVDRYKRNMFSNVTNGKYKYLSYEDYLCLFKALCETNSSFFNDIKKYYSKMKEKLKLKNIFRYCTEEVLTFVVSFHLIGIITSYFLSAYLTLDYKNGDIFLKMATVKDKNIDKVSEASEFLGEKVSLDEIIDTINNNDKIDSYYKQYAIDLAKYLFNKYPDADLRIFNENMKDISINVVDDIFLLGNVAGLYFPLTNSILFDKTHSIKEEVITHELMHSAHHWVESGVPLPKIRSEYNGKSLDEAMTNYLINGLVNTSSYFNEMSVLNYLMSFVDYDYYDYEQEGISKLINLLKEKYPQVDIDYIVNVTNGMTNVLNIRSGNFKFEDNEEFVNELFDICILSIDYEDDVYYSFNKFIRLFDSNNHEFLQKYLDRYNTVLRSRYVDSELIIDDVNYLTNMIDKLNGIKSGFRNYLNSDRVQLDKKDLYSAFRDYFKDEIYFKVEYNDNNEIKCFFFDMLNIYNDFLYKNGIERSKVLDEKDLNNLISKYDGVFVSGYCISKDDKLVPIVLLNEKDRVYGKCKFVSIDSEGRVILLDKSDMKENSEKMVEESNFKFLTSIVGSLGTNEIVLDEVFWQKQFNLFDHDYKKTEFLFNGENLCSAYLDDVILDIGNTSDGKNTFSLYTLNNGKKEYIYKQEGAVFEYPVNFTRFSILDINKNITSIELSDYLNDDYLKRQVGGSNLNKSCSERYSFLTYDINNDVVWVHYPFNIYIKDYDLNTTINEVYLDIGPGYADIWAGDTIHGERKSISTDFNDEHLICFRDVLDYYNMLSNGVYNFSFSKDEMLGLFDTYINDLNLRSMKNSR